MFLIGYGGVARSTVPTVHICTVYTNGEVDRRLQHTSLTKTSCVPRRQERGPCYNTLFRLSPPGDASSSAIVS
jgi:hypothetical protein